MSQTNTNTDCTLRASSTIDCSHKSYNDSVILLNQYRREAASNLGREPPEDLERIKEPLLCTARNSRDVNSRSEKINLYQQALKWNHCVSGML
jgi:hypothetical protein